MKIEYEIIQENEFKDSHRQVFAAMLKKQGKVIGDFNSKVDRCKLICIATIDSKPIAIGAIKVKTQSDFNQQKAGLPELADEFEWELGYLYTDKGNEGCGIASIIVRYLIHDYGDGALMASTELTANSKMVKILERNGFRIFGKPWKSDIHDNFLGLFLKFK